MGYDVKPADYNLFLLLALGAGQDVCISPIIIYPSDRNRVSVVKSNWHDVIPHGLSHRMKKGEGFAREGVYGMRKQRVQ